MIIELVESLPFTKVLKRTEKELGTINVNNLAGGSKYSPSLFRHYDYLGDNVMKVTLVPATTGEVSETRYFAEYVVNKDGSKSYYKYMYYRTGWRNYTYYLYLIKWEKGEGGKYQKSYELRKL